MSGSLFLSRCRLLRTAVLGYVGAIIIAFFSAGSIAAADEDRPPNVIFILADDLGYGDLGCYGQKIITTPNLDVMAQEGMRFTQCYAGSTVCAPSRCCLMTGHHTGHARVRGNARVPLLPEDVTVAEVFKKAGYRTGLIGKWGLGEPESTGIPNKQGFDYFFGYLNQHHAHNYYPDYLWRNTERVLYPDNIVHPDGYATKATVYSHDQVMEEAHTFITRHQDEPFFLYLAVTIPHANNERGRALGDGMEIPSYDAYEKKDWPNPQKGHAAMISRLDADVGRLMAQLKDLEIDENTIVFFSSDNGPHKEGGADPEFFDSNGPLQGYKRSLTDGGIRVPMIVRWPGHIEAGSVNDHVWAFWDFPPTAAELAGASGVLPDDIDGISVVPTLLDEGKQKEHNYLYWEFHEGGFKQAVRSGPWKAIRQGLAGSIQLYDVSKDIDESDDVSAQQPDVVAQMQEYLDGARTESEDFPVRQEKKGNR